MEIILRFFEIVNIFYLDIDPVIAASFLCDKHVIKMCLESAQMLSMVSWRYGIPAPYKDSKTHRNHPCTLWVGDSFDHWRWLIIHGVAIGKEFNIRYFKQHRSLDVIRWCFKNGGKPSVKGFKHPPLCMPDKYKDKDPVKAYRHFYIGEKSNFARWKTTKKPSWYNV